ncbi:MAG: tetratricopeptide repeat protein [Candidatus Thiodiazotropha sp.]
MKGFLIILSLCCFLTACSGEGDASDKSSQASEKKHKCDEHAAHPDDPGRWASGVIEEELVPGPSVQFCTDAVSEFPGTARFHFQLGRALLNANQYDQAIEALAEAANLDYGPAYAYLADIYRFGLLGEPDIDTALAYYDISIASGFTPAQDAKESMLAGEDTANSSAVDNAAEPVQQYEEVVYQQPAKPLAYSRSFDQEGFAMGSVLMLVYDGDFQSLKSNEFSVLLYFSHLHNYFSKDYNKMDEACSAFGDPTLSRDIFKRSTASSGLFQQNGMVSTDGLKKIFEFIVQTRDGGMGSVIDAGSSIQILQDSAKKDGVKLAQRYGCESQVVKRIYGNIKSFVRNQEPIAAGGWVGLQLSCQKYSTNKGSPYPQAKRICGCFIGKFKESKVSRSDVEWFSANYDQGKNFTTLLDRYTGLKPKITTCLL